MGCKLFRASEMSDLGIARERFCGDRPMYDPENIGMETILYRVSMGTGNAIIAKETAGPMPSCEKPVKLTASFLPRNELVRRFRLTHPIPLPE